MRQGDNKHNVLIRVTFMFLQRILYLQPIIHSLFLIVLFIFKDLSANKRAFYKVSLLKQSFIGYISGYHGAIHFPLSC